MECIKRLIAKSHKCEADNIKIISPNGLPEIEKATLVEVEYEINGKSHTCKVSLTPPLIVS